MKKNIATNETKQNPAEATTEQQQPIADESKNAKLIRKTTEYLTVPFTEKELREKSAELAAKTQEVKNLENRKSNVVSSITASIKEARARIDVLAENIRSGSEMRDVRCEWHMNTPRKGRKTCFRCDSFEIVRETDMLDSDAQMVLDDVAKAEKTVGDKAVTEFDREAEQKRNASDGVQDEEDGEDEDDE